MLTAIDATFKVTLSELNLEEAYSGYEVLCQMDILGFHFNVLHPRRNISVE